MDASQLLPFDVVHRKITKTIAAPGVHGVIAVPQLGRVYASATNAREDGNAKLLTLSLRTMSFTGTFNVGQSPDVLAFDASMRRLYVSAESGVVAVFAETRNSANPLGLSFLATEAHTVAVDPVTHLVYFPLQSGSDGRPQLLIMRPT
jgi:DNA-binding beta-propeller fold protein YncE